MVAILRTTTLPSIGIVEATPKALAVTAILFVVGAMSSGYLFSIGADLWELTMQSLSLTLPNAATLFWVVSVPLGIIGIVLAALAILFWRGCKSTTTTYAHIWR
jgi:hypothetical protein